MDTDIKSVIENRVDGQDAFIKTTRHSNIMAGQKVTLNRKGNILFNSGDIEGARRIFLTTGYTDGLVRVGDYYASKGRTMEALRMYWIAPDRTKADSIITKLSTVIQSLLHSGGNNNE